MRIAFEQSKSSPSLLLLFTILFFSVLPSVSAQQETGSEKRGQEASASQAQATMASLFGRGAKMPVIPRMGGTIALPSFDNAKMTIDEGALRAAERQRPKTSDQRPTANDGANS